MSSGHNITLATVESSAFFLRDANSGAEIIVFGDVEPDSISLDPRNSKVWEVAAPKVAAGTLRAIFIECSFPDSIDDEYLYGHLCPRHLIVELEVLASKVLDCQKPRRNKHGIRKRKRQPSTCGVEHMEPVSPKSRAKKFQQEKGENKEETVRFEDNETFQGQSEGDEQSKSDQHAKAAHVDDDDGDSDLHTDDNDNYAPLPLSGFRVYIIHVKDSLSDEASPRDKILEELREQGEQAGLGCEFFAPDCGEWAFV